MSVAVRLILPKDWFYVTLFSILLSCIRSAAFDMGWGIIVQVLQICHLSPARLLKEKLLI